MSDITQQVKNYCLDLINAQASATIDAAAEYFTDLADKVGDPNERAIYIDAMHSIKFDRKIIERSFSKLMDSAYDDLAGAPGTSVQDQQGGIDTTNIEGCVDIEEKLALETMISKSTSQTELPMQSIVRSINALMGDDWVQNHQNPLSIEFTVIAWQKSINKLNLPLKAYLALYGLFEVEMLRPLPKLYEKIGTFLETLPLRKKLGTMPSYSQGEASGFSSDNDDFGDIDAPTEMPSILDGNESSSEEPAAELNTDILITLLDKLQRNRDLDDSEFYDVTYILNYRALLEANNVLNGQAISPWTIGQINDDVIHMTTLMFNFIMEDIHLPDDIRFQISKLQIAFLKLGLQDKTLFSNKDHAGRELLNDIAASIGLWQPPEGAGLAVLINRIAQLIEDIIKNFSINSQLIVEHQKKFRDFLKGDEQIANENQHNGNNKADKAENAKLYVESTLDKICTNKRIPPIINQILEDYWSKILFLEFLNSGQNSADFNDYVTTASLVVASVQPKYSVTERKEMARQLPIIIKKLKQGFVTISVAAFETVDLFRDLQECHMLVLKERPEDVAEDEFEVSDSEYENFITEQNTPANWDRAELENALLEESIERSLNNSDIDPHAFDDNKNIISSSTDRYQEVTTAKATRERDVIDIELKEARDAYERALKEHQEKKAKESPETEDGDDFMNQFFQDPAYIQKQYDGTRDLSTSVDAHLVETAQTDDDIEEFKIPDEFAPKKAEALQPQFSQSNIPLPNKEPNKERKKEPVAEPDHMEDITGRAQGGLEARFSELPETQVDELIDRLKVGLWVDLFHPDGTNTRGKIMAIVPSVGKYIFGNNAGKKIADYNRKSLAEALRTGTLRVTEDDNAFDKTLESVIANLRLLKKAEDD